VIENSIRSKIADDLKRLKRAMEEKAAQCRGADAGMRDLMLYLI